MANKSSSSFYDKPVLRQQHNPLQVNEPDLSGIVLPPLSDVVLLPTSLSQQLSLLFSLDALLVLVPPVDKGDDQPLGGNGPIPLYIAYYLNRRH